MFQFVFCHTTQTQKHTESLNFAFLSHTSQRVSYCINTDVYFYAPGDYLNVHIVSMNMFVLIHSMVLWTAATVTWTCFFRNSFSNTVNVLGNRLLLLRFYSSWHVCVMSREKHAQSGGLGVASCHQIHRHTHTLTPQCVFRTQRRKWNMSVQMFWQH